MKNFNRVNRAIMAKTNFCKSLFLILAILTLGVGQMWAGQGYNGESHVYLNVNGTTKYYKVSTESWATGSSLPGTWGGVLKDQTFNNVLYIQVKGGAVGGWTENGGNISGTLYYKVTTNTTTPSSGWTTVGNINANYTTKSGNNCFRYKNDYSVNVTPTTPGTYYLHIKITDGESNNRTSYVKIVVPSYTVAGTEAVLGSDWDVTDTDNDMTFSSGTTYTLTKSNVTLSTGTTYECKVALDHSWGTSYPGSNKTFTVAANGHYNVTFSFDASNQSVSVSTTRLYAVIYNGNGKTSGSVPATSYHANGATVTVANNSGSLAKTGYTFGGWNTNSSGTGTNYTAGSGTFTMGSADKNLYAKWNENMSTVTLTASPSGKGSFTIGGAAATSTTAGVTTTRSVTAVPISGYHFVSWSITGGASISSTTTNPTTVTGGGAGTSATLTATFEADDVYTLTVAAGTGISAVTGTTNNISAAQNIAITATVATGYTWSTWTKTGAGTLSTFTAGTKNQTVTVGTAGDITLTASATENMSSLSTSCHYDAGNPRYAAPTVSNSATNVGYATTRTITATAAGTGYTFVGWTLTNCTRTDGGGATANPITIRSNGDGEAATVVANYEEDLSTPYTLNGGSAFGGSSPWWNQNIPLTKASGHSTESVGYYTASIASTNTGDPNSNFQFKIVENGSTWNGLTGSGQYYILRENDNGVARTLSSSGVNIELRADVTGDYLLKVNYSSTPTLTVYFPLAVTWTAASVYSGDAATIAATVNDIETSKSIKFDVYAGSTATGDVIATWSGTTSSTSHTQNLSVTPSFGANETSKQYTVKVTYDGAQTATYTSYVYRKWDIYVQNNCSWASGVYYYGFNNGTNADWPGTPCAVHSGIWYKVTLDGKYPKFILGNGNETCSIEKTGDLTTSISTYSSGSFWNFDFTSEKDDDCSQKEKTYNLSSVTLSDPTVTLTTYDVISTTQIYVKGTITNFGNDGTAASDMQEVGFKIGETKYTTTCTSGSTFERYITGLTANTSYSVKAYATNLHGTGESAATAHTTRATGSYTIKVRTGVSDPIPYIRAFVYSDESCGGTGLTANADGNGVAMTLAITGTTYKWYTYSLSNEYQKFYINENASSTETWDQTAPLTETCYWYHHGAAKNDRFGSMSCPYTTPQLMIEENAGEEDFTYLEMSTSPSIAKTVTLAAKSTYLFKIVYNAEWYGKASVNLSRASNSTSSLSAAVEDNMAITTDVAGDYTFTFTAPGTITVTYPTAYTVTFGKGTGGNTITASATSAGGALTSGDYVAAGDDVTFTQTPSTGYTFAGWYDASTGGSAIASMASDNVFDDIAANATVYAQYTPNNYTVTFDAATNGGSCATESKSVTYDAAYGELPTATHANRQFAGWYTTASGAGSLVTPETIVKTASNHTIYARFESTFEVTVTYKCGSDVLYPSNKVYASATALAAEISAPEILGYRFINWTGSNATFGNASSATTTVNATTVTTITANYTAIPTVYFKNNLGWEKVYVTFDCNWVTAGGKSVPSNNTKPYFEMEQLGTSDIFSCRIPDAYVTSEYAGWKNNIAFDNHGFAASENVGSNTAFNAGEFLGRGDFDPSATMYIPYDGDSETRNSGTYYRTGCWMKYNSTDPGYKVYVNTYKEGSGGSDVDGTPVLLKADVAGGFEFKAKVSLGTANYTYGFMLHKEHTKNSDAIWYTNTATITAETDDLPWHFYTDGASENGTRCGLKTESTGDYEITVSFGTGRPVVDVTYPVSVGDWRLAYNDRIAWSGDAHGEGWFIYSRVVKAEANAEDIVSFYVSKAVGANAHVELQKCTAIDGGTGAQTWTKQGSDLDLSDIKGTGIYNFKITQDGSKVASAAYNGAYSGNFYIRTDASDGGWTNYKTSGTNTMTYSEYAEDNSGFTHYFMRFVKEGSNIKFCIANDYSPCLTEYCVSDTYTNEWIEADGNVRFMWDHRTNVVSRAYISGSAIVSDRFLVLEGDAKMFDEDGNALSISGLNANEMKFTDDQNWIYEATVKAQPNARIKLTAKYNSKIQYFYGAEGARTAETTELLIGGSGTDKYKVRVVYDFKTNRLLKAFIPDGDITANLPIETDLMIIRDHQADAQQITFNGGSLSAVKTVYGAMKFNKWTVNNKDRSTKESLSMTSYERDLFYISFPFDVKLGDVFGFGTYGKHWIIEYYDGKGRAANGFWADSPSNWKFVMPSQRSSFTMKAFEGYILALDLDEMTESSSVWNNGVEDVYVYFPSIDSLKNIRATNRLVTIDQNGYECTINRPTADGDRRVKDSYWHCIGVPSFANYNRELTPTSEDETVIDWTSTSMPYLYEVDFADKSLSITSSATFNFKATWSYLVQYAGASIYWSQVNATPAGIVARRSYEEAPTSTEFCIELQQEGNKADQTFVRLTNDENVTTGFDFNYDLSKEFNRNKANIYTIVTSDIDGDMSTTETAGNCLPMTEQTTIVPMGVQIAKAGEYTISIPSGTNGVGVTLIDNETGLRSNLALEDYRVELDAATYDSRFIIEISPIVGVWTDVEQTAVNDQPSDVRKVIIDQKMYIIKDGKVYDAQGARVR